MDPSTTGRGLYFVGEPRCDVAPTTASVRAFVLDPGFCKPVHVARVGTDSVVPFDDTKHGHLPEEEWMKDSGRSRAQASPRRNRVRSSIGVVEGYGTPKAFVEYAGAMLRTLTVRAAEWTSVARSAARWQQKRCLARFMGRLCDRLFDRTSMRPVEKTIHNGGINQVRRCPNARSCDAG